MGAQFTFFLCYFIFSFLFYGIVVQSQAEGMRNMAHFEKKSAEKVKEFDDVVETFPANIQSQFKFIRDIGIAALDNDTVDEVSGV